MNNFQTTVTETTNHSADVKAVPNSAASKQMMKSAVNLQHIWHRIKTEERGEGLVSFLLIVVAVAVIALYVLGVFESEIQSRVSELDLGEAPSLGSKK